MAQHASTSAPSLNMRPLVLYFLKLGTIRFGGPAALVGYMRKDLVDDGQRLDESPYNLPLALAQSMPGPLAAQTAIAIGYLQGGVLGATLVGLACIVPFFLIVLALSWLYVTFGGLPWMQALFYGIGAVVIAIIAIAADIATPARAVRARGDDTSGWSAGGISRVFVPLLLKGVYRVWRPVPTGEGAPAATVSRESRR